MTNQNIHPAYDRETLVRHFPDEGDLLRFLYTEELLSQRAISQILGCCEATVLHKMQRYQIPTRPKANAQLLRQGHCKHSFDGNTCQKAYMIGFCVGDCHARQLHERGLTIRVESSSTRIEQLVLFTMLFSPFGHVWKGNPDRLGKIVVVAYLDLSFGFLLDLKDEIPDCVVDEESFFAFLAGYVDAEGHFGINSRGQAELRIQTDDANILRQIHIRLVQASIQSPKPWICKPQGYTDGRGIVSRHDCWSLQITKKDSLLRLSERLTPYLQHAKRLQDMEVALANIRERSGIKRRSSPVSP